MEETYELGEVFDSIVCDGMDYTFSAGMSVHKMPSELLVEAMASSTPRADVDAQIERYSKRLSKEDLDIISKNDAMLGTNLLSKAFLSESLKINEIRNESARFRILNEAMLKDFPG